MLSQTSACMVFSVGSFLALVTSPVQAQCPTEPPLENWAGPGTVVCPCFVAGEEAGAIFDLPAADYPIEILRIQVGWGSVFGGNPPSLESAIHLYPAGLPNPGVPQFSLVAPVLSDGFINEFDIEPLPGSKVITSGPFTVTLEFANANSGDPFASSVIHDGSGCISGRNVVNAIPGGWFDSCVLGVTGNWLFGVVYRKVSCGTTCTETASSAIYGSGFPGTLGAPVLVATAPPIVGGAVDLFIGNSLGAPTIGLVFVGFTSANLPGSWGGDLLVIPSFTQALPLPGPGLSISGPIEDDPGLCGVTLFLQILEVDGGAAKGISSSNGLQLNLGS